MTWAEMRLRAPILSFVLSGAFWTLGFPSEQCLQAQAGQRSSRFSAPLAGETAETLLQHVERHVAVFVEPPKHVPTQGMPDGPLLGNRDVGVALAGPPEAQRFHIGKNDFWRRDPGDASVMAVGVVSLDVPALQGASYRQEQDLGRAEVRGTFQKDGLTLRTSSWVDANENLLLTSLRCEGNVPLAVSLRLAQTPQGATSSKNENGSREEFDPGLGMCFLTRKADSLPSRSREVAVASRILGTTARAGDMAGLKFELNPGVTVLLASAVLSDLDNRDFAVAAKQRVAGLSLKAVDDLSARHREWWAGFWSRSFIEIPDQEIEKRWYAALYVMASCSRAGKVAPGLWGNWITTDHPNWHGDFHLNYNFQAPYYIVYSANHADLSLPFYQAILESVPNGRAMAQRHGWKGVHFPVCIGPWGLFPDNPDGDWGQRSDAAFAALNFIWHYQYTRDAGFLRDTAYPYLREVADFWEDYLKFENGRYVIYNDSIHEGSGRDMNPLLSLGLVRTLFKNLVRMSVDLGIDADRRAKWQEIFEKISAFPVQERNGSAVFRYSEKGTAWWNDNTLGIQHVFPVGAIGLDSDPRLLEISRNTVSAMGRWSDNNGFASWYTACARIGFDPKMILARLRAECDRCSYPNLVLNYGGGGIENVAGLLAVNEMLLQSHEDVIRFFPVWPENLDARFGDLRAVGAFLVSAELRNGVVGRVKIRSEKGQPCTVQNPWPGRPAQLVRDGRLAEAIDSPRFAFKTFPGELIELQAK